MIRIFSVSGDLVYESEHQKTSSAESAWRQSTITFSGRIVSGIYFWVVESLDPESTGNIQKGTLAVVIEFKSKEKALGWYNSDAHQGIVKHRRALTDEKSTWMICEESSTMK